MKNNNRILYLLQEIGIVVVGVLIAVSINNYKEKSDNEAYSDFLEGNEAYLERKEE